MKLKQLFGMGIFLLLIFSCSEKVPQLDYCQMLKTDQSFVNNDKSDIVSYEADKNKRAALIKTNFQDLIAHTRSFGFPKVEPNTSGLDSCKYWGVTMTMLHSAQIQPEVFFSKSNAALFQHEITNGNLKVSMLEKCVILLVMTEEICRSIQSDLASAVKLWGLDKALLEKANFVQC